jgi:hypothetical protein
MESDMSVLINWYRQQAGHYISDDEKIEIRRGGRHWYVFVEGDEWGGPYAPFKSLMDAQVIVDEHRFRGFV